MGSGRSRMLRGDHRRREWRANDRVMFSTTEGRNGPDPQELDRGRRREGGGLGSSLDGLSERYDQYM